MPSWFKDLERVINEQVKKIQSAKLSLVVKTNRSSKEASKDHRQEMLDQLSATQTPSILPRTETPQRRDLTTQAGRSLALFQTLTQRAANPFHSQVKEQAKGIGLPNNIQRNPFQRGDANQQMQGGGLGEGKDFQTLEDLDLEDLKRKAAEAIRRLLQKG